MTIGNAIALLIVAASFYGLYRAYKAGLLHLPRD